MQMSSDESMHDTPTLQNYIYSDPSSLIRRLLREHEEKMRLVYPIEHRVKKLAQGYKTFPYSTQLSTKFNLLINVKMPTVVGIFTFISMIKTLSERLKARNFCIVGILVFMGS